MSENKTIEEIKDKIKILKNEQLKRRIKFETKNESDIEFIDFLEIILFNYENENKKN